MLPPGGAHSNVTTTATVNRPKNLPTSAAGSAAVIASGPSGTSTMTNNSLQGTSINPSVNNDEDGINKQPSIMQPSNPNMQRRSSGPKTVTMVEPVIKRKGKKKKKKGGRVGGNGNGKVRKVVKKKSDTDVIIIDDDEASAKIATNRPRLVRQSAFFSEEVVIEPEIW